jgi:methylenetetrahydrofolate reductase (NADPH)
MIQPTVRSILEARERPTLSLEFYPPKNVLGFGILGGSIERMRPVRPDFTTCTYGAGGSTRDNSFAAWELLDRMGFTPVVAHLTCVGATRAQLEEQIHRIHGAGIRNIMALRGDPPRGETAFRPPEGGLAHASDLVELVKTLHPDICCGVAGYPETHPESPSRAEDIHWLKHKVDAGADFVNTQLFYDNRVFLDFVRDCRAAGIAVPIIPGLMPVATREQLARSVAFSRATVPAALADAFGRAPDDDARRAIGMRWTIDQIDGLVAAGASGIHLYILNQANTVLDPGLSACLRRWHAPAP